MATLNTEKKRGKDYCRLWFTSNGKRHPIALGYAANKKQLRSYEKIAEIVSEIEIYKKTNQRLPVELQGELNALAERFPELLNKMQEKGFVFTTRERVTLGELAERWFELKLKLGKARTARNYRQAFRAFVRWAGDDTLVTDVTEGDVVEFVAHCLEQQQSATTIGNYLKRTKAAFKYAVKKKWVDENPIQYESGKYRMKKSKVCEDEQRRFVTKENLDFLLSQDMHFEWRVLLHIVRYTGCRIGEALILRWSDVNFDGDDPTITFRSKDTTASQSRNEMPERVTPLWSELLPILQQAYDVREPNDEYVLNEILNLREKPEFERTNDKGEQVRSGRYETNAFRGLRRIIKRNGLTVWPKLWHAIRDFRINEVENQQGVTVKAMDAWFGNSASVRDKHYSATRDLTEVRQRVLNQLRRN